MFGHHVLRREQRLSGPPEDVFGFFADAGNLEAITPDWLSFRIVTPQPIEMRVGALIEYRLRLHGVPVSWLTRIAEWEPGVRFVDEQIQGPYKLWHHTHEFFDADPAHPHDTLMRDTVRWAIPFGPAGELARRIFVQRDLDRIFDHRVAAVNRLLGGRDGG